MPVDTYSRSVFLNFPFDPVYDKIFEAITFAVSDCGFSPCCAKEHEDGGQPRIQKIQRLIGQCRFGIHDISRTELDTVNNLPRFNMPFELGLFLGARRWGPRQQRRKIALILDREPNRYQKFLSDIAGQDIRAHENKPDEVIRAVRNWLSNNSRHMAMPSGSIVYRRYLAFTQDLPALCTAQKLVVADLTFNDLCRSIAAWIKANR